MGQEARHTQHEYKGERKEKAKAKATEAIQGQELTSDESQVPIERRHEAFAPGGR